VSSSSIIEDHRSEQHHDSRHTALGNTVSQQDDLFMDIPESLLDIYGL